MARRGDMAILALVPSAAGAGCRAIFAVRTAPWSTVGNPRDPHAARPHQGRRSGAHFGGALLAPCVIIASLSDTALRPGQSTPRTEPTALLSTPPRTLRDPFGRLASPRVTFSLPRHSAPEAPALGKPAAWVSHDRYGHGYHGRTKLFHNLEVKNAALIPPSGARLTPPLST